MCILLQDLPKPDDWSAAFWLLTFVLGGVGAFIARVGYNINASVQEQKVAIVSHTAATTEMSATIKASTLVMADLATQMKLLVQQGAQVQQQLTAQASAIFELSKRVSAMGTTHEGGTET